MDNNDTYWFKTFILFDIAVMIFGIIFLAYARLILGMCICAIFSILALYYIIHKLCKEIEGLKNRK